VRTAFHFDHTLTFDPARAEEILKQIPTLPGVFALCGHSDTDEPYLTRTANLRRRITRMLMPQESQTKRLNLSSRVARIEFSVTGSEFESLLLLYHATSAHFGTDAARKRLKLHTPFFIRFLEENPYPRAYITNRLSKRALHCFYGPFPSRAAAERYLDETLNLFKLRRCHEELAPDPAFPGCIYSEMKMCLAPCFKGCTDEQYKAEAVAVRDFFDTCGESLLAKLSAERDAASTDLDFEKAAAIHVQIEKAKSVTQLADEIVRPLTKLNAVILQPAAKSEDEIPSVALFSVEQGCISGPCLFSTLGMRVANEQSGSTSLFAQPHMLAAVPEEPAPDQTPSQTIEERLRAVLDAKEMSGPKEMALLSDHLSLLRRWYYRPAKQRVGEIFFVEGDAPVRRILRGISRVAAKEAGTLQN